MYQYTMASYQRRDHGVAFAPRRSTSYDPLKRVAPKSYFQRVEPQAAHAKDAREPVREKEAPKKSRERRYASWMVAGTKLAEIHSKWSSEDAAVVPERHRDDAEIARDSLRRFQPCQHVSREVSIVYNEDHVAQTDCGICALAHTGFIEYPFSRGKLEIHTSDERPFYGPETIVSFYCMQGNLHAQECACAYVATAPGACANARAKAGLTPHRSSCNQRFYACARDIINGDARENGLSCCWNMHLSDRYPIYTCMVALELVSGQRFDCSIPSIEPEWQDVTSAIAYNSEARLVIACAHDDAIRIAREILMTRLPSCIGAEPFFLCVLANSQVRRVLPAERLGACRHAPARIAQNFMELAQLIVASAGYHGSRALIPSREQTPAQIARIAERVRSGRLLSKETTLVSVRIARQREPDEKIYPCTATFPRALSARARDCADAADGIVW